jgi:hypothetical protein
VAKHTHTRTPLSATNQQDLRRSNFTSADCKQTNFKGSKLQGAYFMKAVAYKANFEGADLSDVLMDRAVIVDANLRNAVLQRAVFTVRRCVQKGGGLLRPPPQLLHALSPQPQPNALLSQKNPPPLPLPLLALRPDGRRHPGRRL